MLLDEIDVTPSNKVTIRLVSAWGKVLKAVHRETKFELAIKIISNSSKALQESIQKEVEILKKCRCPSIVAYYGSCIKNDEVWVRTTLLLLSVAIRCLTDHIYRFLWTTAVWEQSRT